MSDDFDEDLAAGAGAGPLPSGSGATRPGIFSPRRRRLFLRVLANGLAQAIAAAGLALLVNRVFEQLANSTLAARPDLLTIAGFGALAISLLWLRRDELIQAERFAQDYLVDLRLSLYDHLMTMESRRLSGFRRGSLIVRLVGDLAALRLWLSRGLSRIVVAGLTTVGALGALAWLHWPSALACGVLIAITALIGWRLGRRIQTAVRESRKHKVRITAEINEVLSAMPMVQAYGRVEGERSALEKQGESQRRAMIDLAAHRGGLRGGVEAAAILAVGAVVALAPGVAGTPPVTAAIVASALGVLGLLSQQWRGLSRVYEYWQGARVSYDRLDAFFALPAAYADRTELPDLPEGTGRLAIQNVALAPALRDLCANAPGGSRIALVGPSGAGKSTLLMLLAGLVEPRSGTVSLDGAEYATRNPDSIRRATSLVSTDFPLMRGSLSKNLRYRRRRASPEDLERVCALTGLDALIARLPNGMATRIGEGGANLSAGERALVALARGLLGRSRLLLLDDIDAFRDIAAEAGLQRVLASFPATIVFVTQRWDWARTADSVWLLAGGSLICSSPASPPTRPLRDFFGLEMQLAAISEEGIGSVCGSS